MSLVPVSFEGLAHVEVHREELKRWALLDCGRCDGSNCGKPRKVLGFQFPECPIFMLHRPAWQMVVRVYNAQQAQKGGLSNWPDGYLSYIEQGVVSLVAQTNKKHAEELESMRSGNG